MHKTLTSSGLSENRKMIDKSEQLIEIENKLSSTQQFKEIWLQADNDTRLCALINGEVGWLMFLRNECDAGFSSRNPAIDSVRDIEFELSNGQLDTYPENWTYPIDIIAAALKSYLVDGERPDQVKWHDDSR